MWGLPGSARMLPARPCCSGARDRHPGGAERQRAVPEHPQQALLGRTGLAATAEHPHLQMLQAQQQR